MDVLKGYASDDSSIDAGSSSFDELEVGSQEYDDSEAVELDENVYQVLSAAELVVDVTDEQERRSPSPVVPDLDVDRLPPPRRGRRIPDGRPPTGWKVRNMEELVAMIQRCGLHGIWAQGGQQSRGRYEGDDFVINIHKKKSTISSTVCVQGKRANEVNARLLAARGA